MMPSTCHHLARLRLRRSFMQLHTAIIRMQKKGPSNLRKRTKLQARFQANLFVRSGEKSTVTGTPLGAKNWSPDSNFIVASCDVAQLQRIQMDAALFPKPARGNPVCQGLSSVNPRGTDYSTKARYRSMMLMNRSRS